MNWKGVDKTTWVRIISLLVLLVNQFSVSLFNHQLVPFTDEQVYEGVSTLLTGIVVFWASWKNNSFTKEAQQADKYLEMIKKGE